MHHRPAGRHHSDQQGQEGHHDFLVGHIIATRCFDDWQGHVDAYDRHMAEAVQGGKGRIVQGPQVGRTLCSIRTAGRTGACDHHPHRLCAALIHEGTLHFG